MKTSTHRVGLLTTRELAEALRLSENTIKLKTRQGLIPFVDLGRKIRRYDLQAVIEALSRKPEVRP